MANKIMIDGITYVANGNVSRNSGRAPHRNDYYQSNNSQPPKRSGAKFQMMDGSPIISAWKKNRKGFYVLYARPYKGTKSTESKNGKKWMNLFVTITNRDTMTTVKTSGLYDFDAKRLYLKDLNQIVTKGGRGGYFGRHMGGNKR